MKNISKYFNKYNKYIFTLLKKCLHLLVDIIYPNKCPTCKKFTDDGNFCLDCWNHLNFITNPCIFCGRPIPLAFRASICPTCPKPDNYYDRIISAVCYNKIIAKTIFEFKYNEKTFLSKLLSRLLVNSLNKLVDEERITIDYIIPIPIHIKKLRKRGFNQSLLLVKDLSKITNIPYIADLLIKSTYTTSQTTLTYFERKRNVKSTFRFNEKYKNDIINKNILIVDDVITTGSTINECAKILKHNKINKLFAISVARGGLDRKILYAIEKERFNLAREKEKKLHKIIYD